MERKQSDQATEEWLNVQAKGTKRTYQNYWRFFLEFTKMNGDQILASRKADTEYKWEKKLLSFKVWLKTTKDLGGYTIRTITQVARGFFSFHRYPLKFRRSETAKLMRASRKTEDYLFTIDDLKRMYEVANLTQKYIITAGKSFGLRSGDFLKLTRGDLEPYIERELPISIGELSTEKEGVPAYPFIDSDAQPIIKLMLANMKRNGKNKPADRILTYTDGIQLTRNLKRIAKKAGIETGNKTVRFHNLRKFLSDHLASHMSESKWKQIVGKKISEGAYVSADTLRSDYKRATAETTFKKPEGNIEEMAKLEAVRAIAKSMGIKGVIQLKMRKMPMRYEIKELEKLIEKTRKGDNEDCTNGVHCDARFEEINESELLSHLQAGWKIEYKSQNGTVIVKR